LGALHELYDRYGERAAFFVVYVKEAHPEDGWVLEENRVDEIAVVDPSSARERVQVAEACATRLAVRMPILLDALDNEVARQYGGWPDRLYLIGRDGDIAYQGGEGPFGFRAEELDAALAAELAT
jgi:hypothetical protein